VTLRKREDGERGNEGRGTERLPFFTEGLLPEPFTCRCGRTGKETQRHIFIPHLDDNDLEQHLIGHSRKRVIYLILSAPERIEEEEKRHFERKFKTKKTF